MREPTLADVPGILFRTTLRAFARLILIFAGLTFSITVALGFCSLFLATWRSPRTPKLQALTDLFISAEKVWREWR